jgi:peptidoglycan/xylan/chitin deacetylase (PgdA/CDA1 family)
MTLRGQARTFGAAAVLAAALASASAAPRARAGDGIPVLIYHEIATDGRAPGETVVALDRFEAQMRHLASEGYQTLSIDELVAVMRRERTAPAKAVVLTFDDGWKNVLNAVPVLNRHRLKASFWIITGAGIGQDYLDWSDVEQLARNPLFQIESHTVSHPWDPNDNLVTWMTRPAPGKDRAAVRAELIDSKATLEARLGRTVDYLAWPVGWFTEEMVQMAREAGYRGLLTAQDGGNAPGDDVFHIRRVFVDGACDMESFRRLLTDPAYRPCRTSGRATHRHTPPDE